MSIPGASEIERAVRSVWNAVSPWIPIPKSTSGKGTTKTSSSSASGWFSSPKTYGAMVVPAHLQIFVQLAGLSGAAAVILGAYGAHAFRKAANPEANDIFQTGNRYHLIHSVALGLVPLTKHPKITGGLLIAGMVVFSGGLYGYALWQNKLMRQVTPFGGVLLILAWLSMVF